MDLFNKIANNEDSNSVSSRLRKKRFDSFIKTLKVSRKDKIIDIGGYEQIWTGTGYEENVTLLNLRFSEKKQPKFTYIECDACNMDIIADKTFDVAFSNSVIEHVGDFERQRAFAAEVNRIARRHWIQTPYKYFPIEPHFLFPFFDLLPYNARKKIALNWKYSHFRRHNMDVLDELSRLRLLTIKEMKMLFPESSIYRERIFGLIKSVMAYKL